MGKIKVKLVKSPVGAIPKQRATVAALGLKKIRQVKEHEDNKAIRGMVQQVSHLVVIEEA